MKLYKLAFIAVAGVASLGGLTSCNDMLDVQTDGHIDISQVFNDRNRTIGYLNRCYQSLTTVVSSTASLTDEAYDCRRLYTGTAYDKWYRQGMDLTSYASADHTPWSSKFQGIRYCSNFIDNIDNFTGLSAVNETSAWKAQAYALRGYYYLELMERYGRVPVFTHDISTGDYFSYGRASIGEVTQRILDDEDEALSAVVDTTNGFSWNIRTSESGIMTRGVCWAVKSRAILYAKSPLFDDGTFTWDDVVKVTGDALYACLTDGGYSLWTQENDQSENCYAAYFLRNPNDRRLVDKETIYSINGQETNWSQSGLPSNTGQTMSALNPTQELVDMYETTDGKRPILGYSDAAHLYPIYNPESIYDVDNPYANRDPRFYASIYFANASKSLTDPTAVVEAWKGGADEMDTTSIRHTHTGYYIHKYNSKLSSRTSNADGYMRQFRLAELYYNFAEAAYNAGGPDQQYTIGPGMTMSAREAVNTVRARVGMPGIPAGLSKSEFESWYRQERMVEFAYEHMRFFDIHRWQIQDVFGTATGMQVYKNDDGTFTYERYSLPTRVATDAKYQLTPIGRTEVEKIKQATGVDWQNPGW